MFYNILLEKFILPCGDILTGSSFMRELRKIRRQDNLSEDQLEQLQLQKLSDVLVNAVDHSEFYGQFKDRKSENPVEFLKKFPILDKQTIHNEQDRLLTKEKSKLIKQSSSGSSGIQTTVYFDKREQSIQRAYQIRWWEWAGYKIGDPLLQTGMNPKRGFIKSMKDKLFRTYYFRAFTYSVEEVEEVLRWATRHHSVSLAGYASSLYVLSRFAEEKNIDIVFKTVISWGDKLFDYYRKSIVQVFGSKVYETYAASEGLMIAAQKDLSYMYIMSLNVFIELLDDNGNDVEDGEIGHVVITKLDGYSMPLIRYRIGDLAVKLKRSNYPDKRELPYPLLQKVIGRDTDIVKTRGGRYMVVHTFTGIFEYFPQIEQFRVIQRELDGIVIEYIPRDNFSMETIDIIRKEISSILEGEPFEITFKKVHHIPATSSGKPQIIQSFLEKSNLGVVKL